MSDGSQHQVAEPERELTAYERFYINQLAELVLLSVIIDSVDECLTGAGLADFRIVPSRGER